MGCIVYTGDIGDDIEDGVIGRGFPVEIFNVLGAGDAFMSSLLRGWLGGESWATAATWANAGGAFAVSRLNCSPEYPTWDELQYFLNNGSATRALRKDRALNDIHWATTRRRDIPELMALACDHRLQLETMADAARADHTRIADFKVLAVKAAARVANGRPGYGMLLDEKHGAAAMEEFARHSFDWLGRPIELPGSRPLRFEFSQDLGSRLVDWPLDHSIKCLSFYHPDDPADLKTEQLEKLGQAFDAARKVGREFLVEIIAGKHGPVDDETTARAIRDIYAAGVKPDWWKLEPQATPSAWASIDEAVRENDSRCRGILLLGLDAPFEELKENFSISAAVDLVKGFAVGRTITSHACEMWLAGRMSDVEAIDDMALRFEALCDAWREAKVKAADARQLNSTTEMAVSGG